MEEILALMIPIIAIVCAVGLPIILGMYVAIRSVSTRHKERMEMIKQGIIPENTKRVKQAPNRYRAFRNGMLCIGVGLGLIIGFIVLQFINYEVMEIILILGSCTLLCLGASYIAFYLLTDKNKEELDDSY